MSMKEQILSIAMQDPRFQETITVVEQQLSGTNIVAEDLSEAIQMLEYVVQNPNTYQEVRMAAIKDGLIDEDMFPPQYDEVLIISLLVVLYGMQDRLSQQGYARGGLRVSGKQLAHRGQGGDRHLAHINDREAEVLRRMGGQGTVNPNTGLREYKGLKNIIKVALPIALSFVAPGIGTAIGSAVLGTGASALAQGIVGGAILGGGTSFLTGGDPILGAVTGGLGGFAPVIGESISAIAPGLDPSIVTGLSGGLTGALSQTIGGGDPVTGFAQGAIGTMLRPAVADMTQNASTAVTNFMKSNAGMTDSGARSTMKPLATTGSPTIYEPVSGATDSNMIFSESLAELPDYMNPQFGDFTQPITVPVLNEENALLDADIDPETNVINPTVAKQLDTVDPYNTALELSDAANPNQGILSNLTNLLPENVANLLPEASLSNIALGGLGLAALGGLSEQDQMAISQADAGGIFDQTTSQYDFVKMRGEANQRGMTLGQFLGSPFFRNDQSKYYLNDTVMAARGGIMDAPGYVNGPGNGRDDVINARLSDGEYVIDAESVSMLGDGSNAAGAEMLDDMRKKLRMHKGKVLAKGEFSPDAKSPLEYMRRSA